MALPDTRAELAEALGQQNDPWASWLRAAELYWASQEMTRVALDASEDLPEWSAAAILPAPTGMLIWEGGMPEMPLAGLPQQAWPTGPLGTPVPPHVPIQGVAWAQQGGYVHLITLIESHRLESASPVPIRIPDTRLWVGSSVEPLPGTDLIATRNTNEPPEALQEEDGLTGRVHALEGAATGVVMATAATWILMQQPTVATPRRIMPRGRAYRTAKHRGREQNEGVSVIDLRRIEHDHDNTSEHDGEPGRTYHHRWIVRGHWRQQAHGPGRTQRRPTWVPSYIKGPAGAPLLTSEHVHTWRR